MKYEILDQPEREIDVTKLICCSYSLIGWAVPPLSKTEKTASATSVQSKASYERSKKAKRRIAA